MTDGGLVLGNIANSISETGRADRAIRFLLQAEARELLPENRIRHCLRTPTSRGGSSVAVAWRRRVRKAYYIGLQTCGQIWVCPVCAHKITMRRRSRLLEVFGASIPQGSETEIISAHNEFSPKYSLGMMTFTIRHTGAQSLREVLAKLQRSYSRFWGGETGQGIRKSVASVGTIRALEVTHGGSGWHPHIHTLLISERDDPVYDAIKDQRAWSHRWRDCAEAYGAHASLEWGLKYDRADLNVLPYLSKIGIIDSGLARYRGLISETTLQPGKVARHDRRTLLGLLIDVSNGDYAARRLWIEGVSALFGKRHLVASRGLAARLGIESILVEGSQTAREDYEQGDPLLAILSSDEWRRVVSVGAVASLLEVADCGDWRQVADFLKEVTGVDRVTTDLEEVEI